MPPGVRALKGHRGHITALGHLEELAQPDVFVTGAQDGHVRVWDTRAARCAHNVPAHTSERGAGAVGAIRVALTGGGGCDGGGGSGSCGDAAGRGARADGGDGIGGGLIVTAGADQRVCALEPRMGFTLVHAFGEHRDFVYSLETFGPLALSGAGDGMLLCHDLVAGKCVYGLGANRGAVRCIHAAPDGLVAAGDDGNAIVYSF